MAERLRVDKRYRDHFRSADNERRVLIGGTAIPRAGIADHPRFSRVIGDVKFVLVKSLREWCRDKFVEPAFRLAVLGVGEFRFFQLEQRVHLPVGLTEIALEITNDVNFRDVGRTAGGVLVRIKGVVRDKEPEPGCPSVADFPRPENLVHRLSPIWFCEVSVRSVVAFLRPVDRKATVVENFFGSDSVAGA